jgi:L-ascorbate metabolism protein UlaG (beta-lactamase superfamily)
MRVVITKVGLSAYVVLASTVALAQADTIQGSRAFTFPENNNQLIAIQQRGGDPAKDGRVTIEFYGHMAFKVTSPEGITVLIDPWRDDPSGAWGKWYPREFPEIPVDLAVSTHAHFDHDAVHRPHALMVFERPIGQYQLADVELTGLADKHQCHSEGQLKWDEITTEFGFSTCPPNNPLAFDNTIQILMTGGLRIAVWGDNRPVPDTHLDQALTDLDILILPIDGTEHILTYKEVDAIIAKYHPKAIIPAHYLVKGAESVLSGLKSADEWVANQHDVRRIDNADIEIAPADLKGVRGRVYYFGNSFKAK